jgi:hypothetical protein
MLYQNFIATAVAFAAVLSVPANAHPGEVEPILTERQIERRQAATNARHAVARNCDNEIRAFETKRRAKRSGLIHKRHRAGRAVATASATSTANAPTFTALQNVGPCWTISSILELIYHLLDHLCTDTGSRRGSILYRLYFHHNPTGCILLMIDICSTKSCFAQILQTEWTAFHCCSTLVSWM